MKLIVNFIVLFLIFEVASVVFSDLIPNYRKVLGLIQERNVEQQKLERIGQIRSLFDKLSQRRDLGSLRLSQPYFETYLPSQFRDYEVLAIVDGILRSNGFSSQNIAFSESKQRLINGINLPLINERIFNLPLEGSYAAISQVIRDLETNSRMFAIKRIELRRSERVAGSIQANLNVATYSFTSVSILP